MQEVTHNVTPGVDALAVCQSVSFGTETTVTEPEEVFAASESDDDSDAFSEDDFVVHKILGGFVDNKKQLCMMRICYKAHPKKEVWEMARNVIHDDKIQESLH